VTIEPLSWMSDVSFINQEPSSEGGGGDEEVEVDWSDWITEPSAHAFLGQLIHLPALSEEAPQTFWEQGVVVGYLPPDEEEPMALWKVLLDNHCNIKQLKGTEKGQEETGSLQTERKWPPVLGRFEDLEEEEVQQAIEAYNTYHSNK
jgi:hypothetical protein